MTGKATVLVLVVAVVLAGCVGLVGDDGGAGDGTETTAAPDDAGDGSGGDGADVEDGSSDGDDEGETTEGSDDDGATGGSGDGDGEGGTDDSGDDGGSGDGTDGDGATTTTTAGEVPPVEDREWADEEGIDRQSLFQAHAQVLNESGSYTAVSTVTWDSAALDEPTTTRAETRASRSPLRLWKEYEADQYNSYGMTAGTTTDYLSADGGIYRRIDPTEGEVQYSKRDPQATVQRLYLWWAYPLETVDGLQRFRFQYDGIVTREGRTFYRFRSDEFREREGATGNISAAEATLLVTQRGLIAEYEYSFTGTRQGDEFRYRAVYRVTDLGSTTIAVPDWIDDAEEESE